MAYTKMRSKYSPNIIYISIFVIIVICVLYLIYIQIEQQVQQVPQVQQVQQVQQVPQVPQVPQIPQQVQIMSGDLRYSMAPQPLKPVVPINIPTRGLPDLFQSVGVVNIDDKILPLYGRRINSDRWNYYTRTDTYNPVPIPIRFQRRDCMDDIGCNEIMSGDDIKVEVMNKHGKANIYKYDGPKYIGFI